MAPKVYRMYSPEGNKRGVNKREDGIFEKKIFCENTKKSEERWEYTLTQYDLPLQRVVQLS